MLDRGVTLVCLQLLMFIMVSCLVLAGRGPGRRRWAVIRRMLCMAVLASAVTVCMALCLVCGRSARFVMTLVTVLVCVRDSSVIAVLWTVCGLARLVRCWLSVRVSWLGLNSVRVLGRVGVSRMGVVMAVVFVLAGRGLFKARV